MQTRLHMQRLTTAALLVAVGIVIPMFSPLKIVLEPASFTLASHVAIFVGMFISPAVAVAVSLGTTLGFFFGGFPLVVVLRAASQILFVVVGAAWLRARPNLLQSPAMALLFNLALGLVHAAGEVAVVSRFYFTQQLAGYYAYGFAFSVLLLVGVGTLIHSMVDFAIALALLYPLKAQKPLRALFPYALPTRTARA